MEKRLSDKIKAKDNQVKGLDYCDDEAIRKELFTRINELLNGIDNLENAIAVEKTKSLGLNEEEIKLFLNQCKEYDVLNITYQKALTNMLINKIYLYDSPEGKHFKVTVIFNVGKNKVEITDEIYTDIKKNTKKHGFCLLNDSAH